MGIPDSSLLDLVEKVRCWIFLRTSVTSSLSDGLPMAGEGCNFCYECEVDFMEPSVKYHCENCARWLCAKCVQDYGPSKDVVSGDSESTKTSTINFNSCKFCSNLSTEPQTKRKYSDKVYPAESPRESPEPPSPNCSGERIIGHSPHAVSRSSVPSFSGHLSPVSVRRSFSRSDEDDAEDSISNFFSSSSEYFHDPSDIETCSFSTRHEFYTSKSVGSSPSDSPSRIHITSNGVGRPVQREQQGNPIYQNDGPYDQESVPVLRGPENGNEDPETVDDSGENSLTFQEHYRKLQKPLDFENNGLIWSPPPPEREVEETENDYFTYDDDDDEEIGGTNAAFFSSSNVDPKEPLRAVVHGHFRALVSQLLQSEGIQVGKEDCSEDWLDIITAISWQAATFVKPDTSQGGSMDPVDYIKVKCIASGSPGDSTLVKGVVCTKNIKHKRMTSQYKNPRLLLLGGALEFQGVSNQLESFDILRQKEMDHLKMVVSKIEALRTNVLLVEKSVSSYAQEYLLAKDISLVLNVKRSLLERIARCSGALVTPSVEKISAAQLGHCELFYLERVLEEHEPVSQLNKKPSKTLMFFGGCPRRLGCTVLLKGSCRRELKKLKHVVHYAVFAAYHLSLETSFLADEGASLPKTRANPLILAKERTSTDSLTYSSTDRELSSDCHEAACIDESGLKSDTLEMGNAVQRSLIFDNGSSAAEECSCGDVPQADGGIFTTNAVFDNLITMVPGDIQRHNTEDSPKSDQEESQPGESEESIDYYSSADSHQSLLVSLSSHCLQNQTICERSRIHRIKFYGPSDRPLGGYLRDRLFNPASSCESCKESTEAHVLCYMHQQGNLTINVKRLPFTKLPGEQDGKIWMWHRCLRCPLVDGIPPASPRVVMSDAAWGLSFGKFLELSFSNHATANRVATCGHSLQKDCLRYYGYGSMVAFFRYSPIDILSVCLPPPILDFKASRQNWLRKEAIELLRKMEALYAEMSSFLCTIDAKLASFGCGFSDASELHNHVMELKDLLTQENCYYKDVLSISDRDTLEPAMDILELNRIRHSLLIGSHVWDRRLYSLNSLLTKTATSRAPQRSETLAEGRSFEHLKEENLREFQDRLRESNPEEPKSEEFIADSFEPRRVEKVPEHGLLKTAPSAASVLSDTIDSAWTGSGQIAELADLARLPRVDEAVDIPAKKVMSPSRVFSFDSAVRLQEQTTKGIPPASLHLTMLKSFHASGDYRNMIRDPISRTYSQMLPGEAQKFDALKNVSTSFVSTAALLSDGARLMVRHNSQDDIVIAVYDNEPTSIISYALSSKEHEEWVTEKVNGVGLNTTANAFRADVSRSSNISSWPSFGSLDLDYMHYGNYGSEDSSSAVGSIFSSEQTVPRHFRHSFENESSSVWGKAKFSVTCYFAKQFDALRKKCCPSEVDFIRSISRCKPWRAQGGKSNVYFAKSLDDRFIVKQVTKTELESFGYFAPSYFNYMTDSLDSGSPTCLAKVLGIYQVVTKHLKGGKDIKIDLMVMENLFFNRKISRVYDLKGSERSRYNSDTTGADKVLLDMNLLETLRTQPIFLGSKAKRSLERAVWNDTSFLASVDVMDYSLLVGIDNESKELVLGIIDYMRQYTWDKHLETWVKASGILGGPKNASPTIVSPKQYKKRFRKAMTTYFLTLPDQWTSESSS